ncbi:MAG TPA: radical SAM protein, partial [Thermoanaerobaculia bacterium]|nr:radical SAM protein [Thermoanaerobaculia bacterium]
MHESGYLRLLETGELAERVEKLYALLRACTVCPRDCGNDRLAGVLASCASGENPIVSSFTPHFGEEPSLSGTRGAGNIFFGNCNLRCVYCQNYQISQDYPTQKTNEVSVER